MINSKNTKTTKTKSRKIGSTSAAATGRLFRLVRLGRLLKVGAITETLQAHPGFRLSPWLENHMAIDPRVCIDIIQIHMEI